MGLDMYAYVASKNDEGETVTERELAYWRKHPNLHGWMEELWKYKMTEQGKWFKDHTFNGIELELTWQDLDELETDVKERKLPSTSGFFFGDDASDHYQAQDLEFVKNAKAETFLGLRVFYNSSW